MISGNINEPVNVLEQLLRVSVKLLWITRKHFEQPFLRSSSYLPRFPKYNDLDSLCKNTGWLNSPGKCEKRVVSTSQNWTASPVQARWGILLQTKLLPHFVHHWNPLSFKFSAMTFTITLFLFLSLLMLLLRLWQLSVILLLFAQFARHLLFGPLQIFSSLASPFLILEEVLFHNHLTVL